MSFAGGSRKRIRTDGPVAKALVKAVVKGVFWFDDEQHQVLIRSFLAL